MATSRNSRDVRLGVSVETSGEENLRRLGDSLSGLGDAAGESTPELARLRTELESVQATTEANRRTEAAARADLAAARAERERQALALRRLKTETDASTRATVEHQQALQRANAALNNSRAAFNEKRAAVTAAATATRQSVTAERELRDAIQQTATAVRASAAAQTQSLTPVATAVQGISAQLQTLRNVATAALGGTLVGSLARDVAETADAYNNLAARIRIVTGEGAAFDETFQGVFDIAQRTGAAAEEVGSLFTRIATAGRALNISNAESLALVESITQATALSGTGVASSAAAITQFSQALASGVLRGEELNSILEQAPRLARALADGLGVTTGELRRLGEAGALTGERVIAALQGQSAALQREFNQLPPTVGRAISALSNAWTQYIGETDKATGASSAAARAITALAENLDTVGALLLGAGRAAAAYAALNLARSFVESATAARTAATATAAATAATVAHTAATAANTGAQAANATATAATVASVGRLAGVLSTLRTLSFLGVVTNLREIGTAIGEWAARLAGADRATRELEITLRAEESAARANAQAKRELAQQTLLAAERALGLTDAARRVIAEFDGMIRKGSTG